MQSLRDAHAAEVQELRERIRSLNTAAEAADELRLRLPSSGAAGELTEAEELAAGAAEAAEAAEGPEAVEEVKPVKLQTAWEKAQATSGRGRNGQRLRNSEREQSAAAAAAPVRQAKPCVLCGCIPDAVKTPPVAPALGPPRFGLPRFS